MVDSNMATLVNVYRGELVESSHFGSIAIVDSTGRLLAYAGEPHLESFLRSSAKPFQAIPLLLEGGLEEYDLSSEEIAMTCASHGGEPFHVASVAALLRKGELDESDLLCGIHVPFDEKAAAELRLSGESPSVLQNNCSGKHAGMLLAARLIDVPTSTYLEMNHEVQLRAKQTLADFADLPVASVGEAVDGCGVPTYHTSIYRTAFAYARLAAAAQNGSSEILPRYGAAAKEIFDAMTGNPEHVAGFWSITTPLMQSFERQLLAKEGAEGFYSMAVTAELADRLSDQLDRAEGSCIGIAIKIIDGSMTRGRNPAILRTLEQIGIQVDALPLLERYRDRRMFNVAGKTVGEIRPEFDLTFL
jgi:L-asparaginase II